MKTDLDQLPNKSLIRILDLTRKLLAPFDLEQMLAEVLQAGQEVMHADSGSIWLYDESNDTLVMRLPAVEPAIVVKAGEGLVGECLATNVVLNIKDCYSDPRFNPDIDKKTGYLTRSILSIPLVGFDRSLVGVMQLLNKDEGPFNEKDELLALTLAVQSAVALQRAQITESMLAKERLDEELSIAREIQLSTLPHEMPDFRDYDFCGDFLPAESTGGDMFDLVTLENEVFVLMGDATGHGFGPALSATQMQAMLRVALRLGASLDQAYIHVNNQLVEDLPDNKFLTAFIGFLNTVSHTIRYYSGGQGPLLHYRAADKTCEWYPPTSFPVGVMEISSLDPAEEVNIEPGDIFAVISDGLYEYHDENGEQYGEQRVSQLFQSFDGETMDELKDKLLESVFAFGGDAEQLDDITIVLIYRKPEKKKCSTILTCKREVTELHRIVEVTEAFFAENVIDTSIRNSVDLVIEELFVNMVKYNTGTTSRIEIEMESLADGIKVCLTDFDVERFDPTEQGGVDVNAPLKDRTPGGLGIFLVQKMVDSIDYDYQDRVSKVTFTQRVESK